MERGRKGKEEAGDAASGQGRAEEDGRAHEALQCLYRGIDRGMEKLRAVADPPLEGEYVGLYHPPAIAREVVEILAKAKREATKRVPQGRGEEPE